MYDVHVIGGGPSGCFAAYTAAKNGHKVVLSEEHAKLGAPVACSGLVSKSGLDAMKDVVDYRRVAHNRINGAIVFAAGREFRIEAKVGEMAFVIDRAGFDTLAGDAAQKQGVEIRTGEHVKAGQYFSKNIIAADGPNSGTAKHYKFPSIGEFVITCQAEFEYECIDKHKVQAYLSAEGFPGFFGWAIPNGDGSAKVGMGARLPHKISASYLRFLKQLGLDKKKRGGFLSSVIPIQARKKTAAKIDGKNIILVGDAAGQVKATTGGGIFFGSSCGRLAGKYFEKPEEYEKNWREKYGKDLLMHRSIYASMHKLGGLGQALFFTGAKHLGAESFLSKYGQMDLVSETFNLTNIAKHIVGSANGKD